MGLYDVPASPMSLPEPGPFGGLMQGWRNSRFGRGLAANSNALLYGGLGLMSGKNPQEGFRNAMLGLATGREQDTERMDKIKRLRALDAALNDPNSDFGEMSPTTRELIATDPEMGRELLAARLTPDPGTSDMQEYRAAVNQGFTGSFMDYQLAMKKAGATNIDIGGGKLGTNYRWLDPNDPSKGAERIPGVAGSEGEQKGDVLLATVEPDYQVAKKTFDALGNPADLAASYAGDAGRYFQSGDFQAGSDAITSIAQSYIYAVSGAQAPEQEVRRVARLVTPALNDKAEALALKKQRLGTMVDAIRSKAGMRGEPPVRSPQPGDVQDGYRFLGGHPGDQNNWEPVQ